MLRDKTAAQLEKEGRDALATMGGVRGHNRCLLRDAQSYADGQSGHRRGIEESRHDERAGDLRRGRCSRSVHRDGLLLSTPSRTDRGLRQKDRASACLRADGRCPNAANRQGTVSILPVDYLFRSPPLEGLVSGARGGQMWITGQASTLAKSQLASRGWTIVPKAGAQLGQ